MWIGFCLACELLGVMSFYGFWFIIALSYMYRTARQHCLSQVGKATSGLLSFFSGEKLM